MSSIKTFKVFPRYPKSYLKGCSKATITFHKSTSAGVSCWFLCISPGATTTPYWTKLSMTIPSRSIAVGKSIEPLINLQWVQFALNIIFLCANIHGRFMEHSPSFRNVLNLWILLQVAQSSGPSKASMTIYRKDLDCIPLLLLSFFLFPFFLYQVLLFAFI